MDEPTNTAPAAEIDFGGIGRVYIKGDDETSFDEVIEEFNEQTEDMADMIERLKKYDYDLKEEYDEGGERSSSKTFG